MHSKLQYSLFLNRRRTIRTVVVTWYRNKSFETAEKPLVVGITGEVENEIPGLLNRSGGLDVIGGIAG
jgi:hypothetical protein